MQTKKNELRMGQKVVNDMIKELNIEIRYAPYKNGFHTCVSCTKLFNMTDKEFIKRYMTVYKTTEKSIYLKEINKWYCTWCHAIHRDKEDAEACCD